MEMKHALILWIYTICLTAALLVVIIWQTRRCIRHPWNRQPDACEPLIHTHAIDASLTHEVFNALLDEFGSSLTSRDCLVAAVSLARFESGAPTDPADVECGAPFPRPLEQLS